MKKMVSPSSSNPFKPILPDAVIQSMPLTLSGESCITSKDTMKHLCQITQRLCGVNMYASGTFCPKHKAIFEANYNIVKRCTQEVQEILPHNEET